MEQKRILVICATAVAGLLGFVALWEASGGKQHFESTDLGNNHHVDYGYMLGDDHLYDQNPYSTGEYIYDPSRIMILQVNDANYAEKYRYHMDSVKCWAKMHGYQYNEALFHDHQYCMDRVTYKGSFKFYYIYLCVMWQTFDDYPDIEYIVRVDGDVLAGMNKVSLERWLDGADVIVQHRMFTNEITAGTMMVRNNSNGRSWIQNYLDFFALEPGGFSGDDNGAIHLALIDLLRLPGRQECHREYRKLGNPSALPYFETFLDCCMKLLGPARRWDRKEVGHHPRVTIWPAGLGWMTDWMYPMYLNISRLPPFHHGVKNVHDIGAVQVYGEPETWGEDREDDLCVGHKAYTVSDADEGVRGWAAKLKTMFYENSQQVILAERVRKWDPAGSSLELCFDDWDNCEPLGPTEEAPGRWIKFNGATPGFAPYTPEWGPEGDVFTGFSN